MNRAAGTGPLAPEFDAAAEVIRRAAVLARQGQDRLLDISVKSGPADLVSAVDRELDAFIVERLLDRFPADGSLSEEGGRRPGTSGRTWVVDPIDGTHNYVAGLPYHAISIALTQGSQTLLGLIYDATDGTIHSAIAVPDAAAPGPASAGTTAPALDADRGADARRGQLDVPSALVAVNLPAQAIFSEAGLHPPLDRIGDIRITGSLCLDLAWTAAGRFDACAYRHRDNPWDWAAGELIALSRGRSVTSTQWASTEIVLAGRSDVIAALTHSAAR
ncbi:MAG TPA: inositol monophosphatase family protein [Streptosporangiaceae bacterium]|nr:inositol monophosphatase family protein [Streptosporangiaceae bacterium]